MHKVIIEMLIHDVMLDEKILIMTPEGSLEEADFETLSKEVPVHRSNGNTERSFDLH